MLMIIPIINYHMKIAKASGHWFQTEIQNWELFNITSQVLCKCLIVYQSSQETYPHIYIKSWHAMIDQTHIFLFGKSLGSDLMYLMFHYNWLHADYVWSVKLFFLPVYFETKEKRYSMIKQQGATYTRKDQCPLYHFWRPEDQIRREDSKGFYVLLFMAKIEQIWASWSV